MWLAEDLSRVPLTLVSRKSVRDLRRRVSGRDKEREREKEKGKERQDIENMKNEEKLQVESPKELESDSPRRPPRKLKDGLKSMLSFSRLPKLALPPPPPPSTSCTDDVFYKSSSDMGSSSWGTCDLPSSTSLHFQDTDVDMDPSTLSRTSSIHSSWSSYSSLSVGGIKLPPSPGFMHRDLTCLSRDSSLKKFRDRVRGTRPGFRLGRAYLDERHGEMGWKGVTWEAENGGANLSRHSSLRSNSNNGTNSRLVAVKMTPRKVRGAKGRREREEEERTRVGFVREVEVLKVSTILWGFGGRWVA